MRWWIRRTAPGTVFLPKPPGQQGIRPRIVDPHAGAGQQIGCGCGYGRLTDPEARTLEGFRVEVAGDTQGLCQSPGACREGGLYLRVFAPLAHQGQPYGRRDGPHQDGIGFAALVGNDIEQLMDAVAEINVSMSAGAKHDLGALRESVLVGMTGAVVLVGVGFGLANDAGRELPLPRCPKPLSDQVLGDLDNIRT